MAPGAYSTKAAIGTLARELQGEPLGNLPRINQEINDLMTPMAAGYLKSITRGLLAITPDAFPDGYLVN